MSTELVPVEHHALPAVTGPPLPAEWAALKEQALVIAQSGLAPSSVSTKEQVLVIALKGRELAVPPMQALSHIHVIEGKPTLSAEMMAALVQRAGHKLRVVHTDTTRATVQGIRRDDPDHIAEVSYTIEEATAAGVANKSNWKRHPAAMLRARAISALCRMAFADVLMGCSYTAEELGAEVDVAEDGTVTVDAAPAQPEPTTEEKAEHARAVAELGALLPSIPEDKREALREWAAKSADHAKAALERVKKELASQPAETPAPEQAPFEPVSDEVLSDLAYELGQLSKAEREKETARLLGEASVASLEELPDRDARKAQERLTKKRAEREAKEAAA